MSTTKSMKSTRMMGSNPMVRKISKINERSEEHVTFAGISNKCIYFMLTLIAGIALAVMLQRTGTQIALNSLKLDKLTLALGFVTIPGIIGLVTSAAVVLFVPLFAFFMRKAAAVMGTLYCVSVGYLYAFVTMLIAEYRMIVGLAAGITILVCMAMFLLYRSGKVTVNNKLRTVVFTLIFANIVGAILLVICSFIPALAFIPAFFTGNGIISIAISAVGVVIATLFVLIDFDTVAKAVENEIPVENEWYCAFSLAFSVIWLFGKIFNLLVKVFAAAKK